MVILANLSIGQIHFELKGCWVSIQSSDKTNSYFQLGGGGGGGKGRLIRSVHKCLVKWTGGAHPQKNLICKHRPEIDRGIVKNEI